MTNAQTPAECLSVNRRESDISFRQNVQLTVRDDEAESTDVRSEAFLPVGANGSVTSSTLTSDTSEVEDEEEEQDEIADISEDENVVLKSPLDYRHYQTLTLRNGMNVLLINDSKASKCAASLCIQTGSMHDPKQLPGLAHFCENLIISKKSVPEENDESFQKLVTANGGQIHSKTRRDSTTFSFDVYPESFPTALRQFAKFFLVHCFTEEDMEQSISSINMQFEKVLVMDEERRNRIDAALCKISHPYHKFIFGNTLSLWTRPKSTFSKLRDQVMRFIQEYYSANLMHLVVLGSQDLTELESLVETYFSLLQNSGTTLSPWSASPYGEEHVKTKIDIVPITNFHQLLLIFPVPDYTDNYKSGIIPYMQFILGYEGRGSLLSLLRDQSWADSLVPEYKRPARGFAIFTIDIHLTHSGLKNIYNITHNVFQYFKLLRDEGPQRWLWEEIRLMDSARFQFQEEQSLLGHVESIATSMPDFPKHHCVGGKYLVRDYMPGLMRDFVERLVPRDLRMILSTKYNLKDANKTEEWFGINYRYSKIDKVHLKKWSNCELHEDLHLPRKSGFIPESFQIKLKDLKPKRNVPRVITEDSVSQVWFCQDPDFLHPSAIVTLVILSPLPRLEAIHFNSIRLIEKILNDSLLEISSDARHAGLYHKIEASLTGLTITVHGYDNKIQLYFNTILSSLFQFCSTGKVSIRFQDIKEASREHLNNWRNEEPYIHAMEYVRELLNSHAWNPEQLIQALNVDDLDSSKLMHFCQQFLRRIKLTWFFYGNLTESEAHRMYQGGVKYFDSLGSEPISDPNLLTIQEAVLPFNSYTVYHAQHPAHVESSCVTYLQTGCGEIRETVLTELIALILRQPALEILRTADQLVWTEVRRSRASVGFEIILQEERDPSGMETSIEEFLTSMQEKVSSLSPESFRGVKREVKLRKMEKSRSFRQRSRFLFEEILRETYNFQRNTNEILDLEIITLEEVVEFYQNRIAPNGSERKRVTVLVASAVEKENLTLLQNSSAEAIMEMPDGKNVGRPIKSRSSSFKPPQRFQIQGSNREGNIPSSPTPSAEQPKQKKTLEVINKLPDTPKVSQTHHIPSSNRITSKTNQRPKTAGSLASSASISLSPYQRKRALEQKFKLEVASKYKSMKDQTVLLSRISPLDSGLHRTKDNVSKHSIAIRKNSIVARPATSGVSGAPYFMTDQQKSDNWRRFLNKDRFSSSRSIRQESLNDLPGSSKSRSRVNNSKQIVIPREDLDFREYDFDFEQEIRRLKTLKKYLEYDIELRRSKGTKGVSEDETQNLEAPAKPHVPPDFSLQYEIRRLRTLRDILDEEASAEKEPSGPVIPYSHPVRKKKPPPPRREDNCLTCTVHDVEKEIRRLVSIKKYFDGETPSMNLHSVEYTVFVVSEIKFDNEEAIRAILQSKLAQQTHARVSSKNPHLSPIQFTPRLPSKQQESSQRSFLSPVFKSKAPVTNPAISIEPKISKGSEGIRKMTQREEPISILKNPSGQIYRDPERTFQQSNRLRRTRSLYPLDPGPIYRSTLPFMHFSLSYGPNQTLYEVTRQEKHSALGAAALAHLSSTYSALSRTYPTRFQDHHIPMWTLPKKTENILRIMDIRLGNHTSIRKHFNEPVNDAARIATSVVAARARARNSKRSLLSGSGIVSFRSQRLTAKTMSTSKTLAQKRSSKSLEMSGSLVNSTSRLKESEEKVPRTKTQVRIRNRTSEEKVRNAKLEDKVKSRKSEEKVRNRKSEEKVRNRQSAEKFRNRQYAEKVRHGKSAEKVEEKVSEEKVRHKKSDQNVKYRRSEEKVARIKLEGHDSKINLKKMESISANKSGSSITSTRSKDSFRKTSPFLGKTSRKLLSPSLLPGQKMPFEEKQAPEAVVEKSRKDQNPTSVSIHGSNLTGESILTPTVYEVEVFPEAPSPPPIQLPSLIRPKMSIPRVTKLPSNDYLSENHISELAEKVGAAIAELTMTRQSSFEQFVDRVGTTGTGLPSTMESSSPSNFTESQDPSLEERRMRPQRETPATVSSAIIINFEDSNRSEEQASLEAVSNLVETLSETRNITGAHGKRRVIAECHSPDLRNWMRQVVVKEMQQCIKSLASKSRKFPKSSNVSSYASNVSLMPVLYHPPRTALSGKASSAVYLRSHSTGKASRSPSLSQKLEGVNKMQREPAALLEQGGNLSPRRSNASGRGS